MARRLVIIGIFLGLLAAQLCPAQPLQAPDACPMKTRCCRMLPAQPSEAIRPDVASVALVAAQPLILAPAPSPAIDRMERDAPVREVPTRTIQLRI